MPIIKVHKAFELSIAYDGELKKLPFSVGEHDVPQEVADHWYTQAHSEPVEGEPAKAKKGKAE